MATMLMMRTGDGTTVEFFLCAPVIICVLVESSVQCARSTEKLDNKKYATVHKKSTIAYKMLIPKVWIYYLKNRISC